MPGNASVVLALPGRSVGASPRLGTFTRRWAVLGLALGLLAPAWAQGQGTQGQGTAEVSREARGARLDELMQMELKPTPADLWAGLSDWSGGQAPAADSQKGSPPVLIVTFASWAPDTLRTVVGLQKLAEEHAGKGLVVIGVGRAENWEDTVKDLRSRGVTFTLAQDAKGDFRKALKIDNDPDMYVLDRAGHVRYTDIATNSAALAAAEVVAETMAQAGDVPRILRERDEQKRRAAGKTVDIKRGIELDRLPAVPPGYADPPEIAFKDLTWPKIDPTQGRELGLIDQQTGRQTEPKLIFAPQGWFPAEPERKGRATVLYVWHPDIPVTYDRVMPQMDLLQTKYQRDLAVIGAVIPTGRVRQDSTQQSEDLDALAKRVPAFLRARKYDHTLAADIATSSLAWMGQSSTRFPIPFAIIASSDGTIRWAGVAFSDDFRSALDRVLAIDPGVRLRRMADERFIRAR